MRIAVVTCKVKPPSADIWPDDEQSATETLGNHHVTAMQSPGGTGDRDTKPSNNYPSSNQQSSQLMQIPSHQAVQPSALSRFGLPAQLSQQDDFLREVIQLCRFHGKSKQELYELMDRAPEDLFASLSLSQQSQQQPPTMHGPMSASSGSPYTNNQGGAFLLFTARIE